MNNKVHTALKSNPFIKWDSVLHTLFNKEVEKLHSGSQLFYTHHKDYPKHDNTLAWYEHDKDEVLHCCDIHSVNVVFQNNTVRYVANFSVRQYHNQEYIGVFNMKVLIPVQAVLRLKSNYPEMWDKLLAI